ncbi:uncharacterized protein B0P05DRAFT_321688 [Gilbertella persicaria]|uniref:uncharacterized protein n=1 Tax=Gilbertella persicaria TaxID=101096 RepID=UPI00221EC4F0|nr:uncharacterized protein B0P05DRAFT_321688 [Gilbertella persicaria]KAI8049816.1 hypothetical protein B0P05DRAFT_321688 [Gilbertella persicaria]
MKDQLDKLNNDVARSTPDSAPDSEQQNVKKKIVLLLLLSKERLLNNAKGFNSILGASFNFPSYLQIKNGLNQENNTDPLDKIPLDMIKSDLSYSHYFRHIDRTRRLISIG